MSARKLAILSLITGLTMAAGSAAQASLEEIRAAIAAAGAQWTPVADESARLDADALRLRCGASEDLAIESEAPVFQPGDRELPPAFSWKDKGGLNYLTGIRNQGGCGSCWDFGAIGALEGWVKVVENIPFTDVDLSEQFILSCAPETGSCAGGWPSNVFEWLRTHDGLPDEACMPYQANDAIPCDDACDDWLARATRIESYIGVANGVFALKHALYEQGPVTVCFDVYEDFGAYAGGVYQHAWGQYVGGHCVVLAGWDDAEQSWLAKNSWGGGWGEQGYFRIRWGDCNFGAGACYPDYRSAARWPHLSQIAYAPMPLDGADAVTVTAVVDNAPYGGTPITLVELFVDELGDPYTGHHMLPVDGAMDSPTEAVTLTLTGLGFAPGTAHLFYLRARSYDMQWSPPEHGTLPVYDCAQAEMAACDAGDTELAVCDLREVAVYADAQALNVWVDFDPGDWHDQLVLGLMIDRDTPDGGVLDPIGTQIRWDSMAMKPDYFASLRLGNNLQQLRRWNGSSWVVVSYGTGALGWSSEGALHVLSLPLSELGSPGVGEVLNVEVWVNLATPSSGALDLLASDGEQESAPDGTRWGLPENEWTRPDTWQSLVVGGGPTSVPLSPGEAEGEPGEDGASEAEGSAARLLGAWPNPFNPATEIAFTLPVDAQVELAIYTPSGRLVALPARGPLPAGEHRSTWDGKDLAGQAMPSGIYLVSLRANGAEAGRIKLVLAK